MYIQKCVCGMYSKTLDTRFSDKINYAFKKVTIQVLAEVVHCFTRKKKRKKRKKKLGLSQIGDRKFVYRKHYFKRRKSTACHA